MANTTNLNLGKLSGSEKLKTFPTMQAGNMDAIDSAFGSGFGVGTASNVNSEISSLGDGLAILAVGNTHAAITAGQYVYVRQHSSLTDGLYTANSNISANATLSSSNLTANSSGGLNALNSNLSSVRNYTSLGNIASESALGTSLTSQLSEMPNNSAKLFKFIATANDGFIENGNIYFVTLQKNDDGYFASAMINRLGSVVVIGAKGANGWSFEKVARLTKKIYTIAVTATAAAPLGYYGSLNIQTDRAAYGEPISIWGMDKNGYATPVAYGNNNYIGVCARVEGNCSVTVIFSKHTTTV